MHEIERYTRSARWFHWLIVAVFVELALSGLLLFFPWFSFGSAGTLARFVHRVGALALVAAPAIYGVARRRNAWYFIKEAFSWGREDLEWLRAAPGYYFGGDPRLMPPQGYINTGMKLYRLAILFGGFFFVVTGALMWFFGGVITSTTYRWSLFLHDLTFLLAIGMLFLHAQLGVFHPRMDESVLAMVDGKVSGVYAKSHHGKWYAEITSSKT